jgi:diaminohydroxyphosphoribosylaminopyrimidine deaminase / 5-amino-6-(5-phosphoribosylamino)uracil reductase
MERAVTLARRSRCEPNRSTPAPNVGVVVVKDGEVLGESFRGETGNGDHAEFGLLTKLAEADLTGAEIYTTLEPCTRRNEPKLPCAQRLLERKVGTVYIGMYDPNPVVYRAGWKILRDGGVTLKDFDRDLREMLRQDSAAFIEQFQRGEGDEGEAVFDYLQNGGTFTVTTDSAGSFTTRWSRAGGESIHAYEYPALARYARTFNEIDDPGALDYSMHGVTPRVNDIVVFQADGQFLLVQVLEVHGGPEYGSDHTAVKIRWQARRSQ